MRHYETIIVIIIFIMTITSCNHHIQEFKNIALIEYGCSEDSINYTITVAKDIWESTAWKSQYSYKDFIKHVLPPSIANEPIEYYWLDDIPSWVKVDKSSSDNIIETAQKINNKIDIITKPDTWGNPQMSYSETISGKFGKCDDRTILTVMAMRSYGIPSAFEFIPCWGNTNNGHSFCSVILPTDSLLIFQEKKDNGISVSYTHKVPKIYRKTFFPNYKGLAFKYYDTEEIPPILNDLYIEDVTDMHDVGHGECTIPVHQHTHKKLAYLCVFTPTEWIPIAYGEIKNGKVEFQSVGNGGSYDGRKKGENLGDGILYLPVIYDNHRIIPIESPFIFSSSGLHSISPSRQTENVLLTRKYPRFERILRFATQMIGGIFEASTQADFSDAVVLHTLTDLPLSRFQIQQVFTKNKYNYARFRKPTGTFSLSELAFYDSNGEEIKGIPFVPNYVDKESLTCIYDKEALSYYEINGIIDFWAGLEFESDAQIESIGFCPRTDDNDICPGDLYELFYWDNGWISLGQKIAKENSLTFQDVPQGSLLLLRDLTRGKEERPFTYENGKQIWW